MDAMHEPEHFEIVDDIGIFRPAGHVSLNQMVQLVTSAITFARDQNIRRLLVVTSALFGFEAPSAIARFEFIQEWAYASGGVVRVALVARPEMIDPQKFGVIVAANRGLVANIFVSEPEAITWLQNVK